jgi:hypothetical protein
MRTWKFAAELNPNFGTYETLHLLTKIWKKNLVTKLLDMKFSYDRVAAIFEIVHE